MLICALWDSLGQTFGGIFPLLEQVAVQSAWGVFSVLCPDVGGVAPLCAGDLELLLLFCFLALSPPQFPPVYWAVLLFWTGQLCRYLTLEFSVCGDCIVYPYGQMADLITLLSSLLMDQQFLLYSVLPDTSV